MSERASAAFSATELSAIFCSDARSAPEQKSRPAPEMTTTRTAAFVIRFLQSVLKTSDQRFVERVFSSPAG